MSIQKVKIISGFEFPFEMPDLMCHLQLFLKAPKFQREGSSIYTGEGRMEHARVVAKILWPKAFQWHDWSEKIVAAACDCDYLCITGCGASSKSTSIGMYALIWWMSAPTESAVIIASKTIESAKKRIWREVARLYGGFSNLIGGYKDAVLGQSPRPYICPISGVDRKKDEAHGLFVTALHGKELEKEIGYIKGYHPKRILVAADELDVLEDGGQALIDTFTDNLRTGTYEAQFIGLGNDPSLFNALGDMMAPEVGRPVGLKDVEWTSAKNVKCLRLDAWESPNIKDRDKWTGLVRQRDIDDLVARKGENSPSVWIQLHGLHPPEGSANTVLSEATLIRFHAFESVTWKTDFTISASLDPAFGGGDDCTFRTFKRGNDTTGKLRILCWEIIQLPVSANDPTNPAEYQIASKVRELCKSRGIAPDEFVVGSTGIGRGVGAVLQREWSPRIQVVDENGAPSEMIVSEENPRPAKELYDRKVTELWFSIREFVEGDMIRGLDRTTANQLCSRTYEDKGSGGSRKDSIQKKDEMLHSPNESDALAFYIHLLREKGIYPKTTGVAKIQHSTDMQKAVEQWDFEESPQAYSDPLLDLMPETF
jgi:hypothetical protein